MSELLQMRLIRSQRIQQVNPPMLREAIHLLGEMERDARCDRQNYLADDLKLYRQNLLWLLPEVIACNGKSLIDTVTGMRFDLERPRKLIPRHEIVRSVFISWWQRDTRCYSDHRNQSDAEMHSDTNRPG